MKKLYVSIISTIKKLWRYLKEKNAEAIQMENRATAIVDERYTQNWHSLRGYL